MSVIAFYAVLPATIRYDRNLPDKAKLLYAEITAALNFRGECEELSDYFARLLDIQVVTIRKYQKLLESHGYIKRETVGKKQIITIPKENVVIEYGKKESGDVSNDVVAEVLRVWGKLFKNELKHGLRKTDDLSLAVADRLQTFSKDDILAALQNRHDYVRNSEWHNKPENVRHMAEISHVLKSDDALRSNLNLAVAEIGRDWKKTTKPFEPKEDSEEALK